MKEKLEKIRDISREMLMRPGGAGSLEWRRVWHLACDALNEAMVPEISLPTAVNNLQDSVHYWQERDSYHQIRCLKLMAAGRKLMDCENQRQGQQNKHRETYNEEWLWISPRRSLYRQSVEAIGDAMHGVGDNERRGMEIPIQYGIIEMEIIEDGCSVEYDVVTRLPGGRYLGINFTPYEEEGEDGETSEPTSSA